MAKRDDPQFRIRLPAALKKQIEDSAKSAGRSLNSEIEKRLESTFKDTVFSLDDDDAYRSELLKAEQDVQRRLSDLERLPQEVDPVERAIARYELRKAENFLDELKEDFADFLENEKLFKEIYYPNESDEDV